MKSIMKDFKVPQIIDYLSAMDKYDHVLSHLNGSPTVIKRMQEFQSGFGEVSDAFDRIMRQMEKTVEWHRIFIPIDLLLYKAEKSKQILDDLPLPKRLRFVINYIDNLGRKTDTTRMRKSY